MRRSTNPLGVRASPLVRTQEEGGAVVSRQGERLPKRKSPSPLEYLCGACGHRQRHAAPWWPGCGQAVRAVARKRPTRFGLEQWPAGLAPVPVDPDAPQSMNAQDGEREDGK